MIEIKARSGWSTKVYEPLITHRWAFYAHDPAAALQKLCQLPQKTIQSILEHLYANTPVARTNLAAFKLCKVVESIPFESTYHRDMLELLNDNTTCDFSLLGRDSNEPVTVHSFMLSARSAMFRQLFSNTPEMMQYQDQNMCRNALVMFTTYLYTGRLDPIDEVALIDLYGAGRFYGLRDPEEIDYLATSALEKILSQQNAPAALQRAQQRELPEVIELIKRKYPY